MDDLRLSIRALRASPIVSGMAMLSLALGIGANTAIFSLVNSLLLRTLPVAAPERLVTISSDQGVRLGFNAGLGWSYAMWQQLRQRADTFDGAFAWTTQRLNLAANGETEPVDGLIASGEFFTVLGVTAALGRAFTIADDVRGGGPNGPVVVISDGLWRRRFGGDPAVIGRPLVVDGVPLTIVGVTPPGFLGVEAGRAFDLAIPLATEPLVRRRATIDQPGAFILFVMLRLKPGQSAAAATATLRAMQPEMHGHLRIPSLMKEPYTLVPAARGTDIPGSARQRYERPLLAVFVVVGLVLLIACGNIANLLLARGADRRHEMSIRTALGAPGWRLARQLFTESVVLAGAGALAGLLFAAWAGRALVAQLSGPATQVTLDASFDWRVFAFTGAVTVATVLLFGTVPAIRAARVPPIAAVKEQGRGTPSSGRGLSSGLVVAQVALSLVLVVAAGLFIRTFGRLAALPLGYEPDRVLVVNVDTARANVEAVDRLALFHQLVSAASSVPGVEHAAGSTSTPLTAGLPRSVSAPGAVSMPGSERMVLVNSVTPNWFATYGTQIRDGRDIDPGDTATAPPVVVVNEAFARRFFPGRRAIGEIVDARTIVGVVADHVMQGGFQASGRARSLRDEAAPAMYVPLAQSVGSGPTGGPPIVISVRQTTDSPAASARSLSAALTAVNPQLSLSFRPLGDSLSAALAQERLVAWLSGFFGVLALLLAGIGLYGVTAYAVSRRRIEIGIRLALGAPPRTVVRFVLFRVGVLVGAGIATGAAVSVWLSTFVATLLYGVEPRDPITLAAAALTLGAVGALAGWLPARRAARIDPLEVLRTT